ncbi:GNAT family N-acetyltransferase [Ktedonobacter robiniae]|uniref:N-acetyltransferase domain-containing protein n=1 Tax=Ktedonobacter robiniae TaxID=2778365 RepID=A0ABQ3V3C2_9CHLR|nr:GNAT family N-acetyltransferase [Ktedonobacter robiniae]GHO59452.1 hypothetical protein KSB_79270 [Ktedonobacter robiniae]
MPTVTFQLVTLDTLNTLIEFMRQFYAHFNYALDESKLAAVEQLLQRPDYGRIWLIYYDQQPAGYIILTFGYSIEMHGRDALIDELFIDGQYRGKKIGEQTIKFIEETCKQMGMHALHLEVEHENIGAHRLYRRLGFEEHERHFMTRWLE